MVKDKLLKKMQPLQYRRNIARSLRSHRVNVPPKKVQVEITNKCNLKCVMCDRWQWPAETKNAESELSTQELTKLFSELKEMGVDEVMLTGGETMIRPDFSVLISELAELGLSVALITNGTLITREIATILVSARAKIMVSVDGAAETHDRIRGIEGTFNRVLTGIEKLVSVAKEQELELPLEVNYTVQSGNVLDMLPFFKIANRIGVSAVLFNLVHGNSEVAPDKDDLELLKIELPRIMALGLTSATRVVIGDMLQAFVDGTISLTDAGSGFPAANLFRTRPVPCITAYRSSFIDSFGRVFPCCYCYFDNLPFAQFEEERQKYCLGNITDSGFADIWYGVSGGYANFREISDPVNMDEFSLCCGQCYDYFLFEKAHDKFKLINKLPAFVW